VVGDAGHWRPAPEASRQAGDWRVARVGSMQGTGAQRRRVRKMREGGGGEIGRAVSLSVDKERYYHRFRSKDDLIYGNRELDSPCATNRTGQGSKLAISHLPFPSIKPSLWRLRVQAPHQRPRIARHRAGEVCSATTPTPYPSSANKTYYARTRI
jgi:hypothetical protein